MKASAHSADRISGWAVLLAGAVGGVLVFVVALPLALSSPFPTPRQSEWVVYPRRYSPLPLPSPPPLTGEGRVGEQRESGEGDGEASFSRLAPLPPLTEGSQIDPPMVMAAAFEPGSQPEPITFAERWILDFPQAAAMAAPAANEVPSIEVPPQATRLAPPGNAIESPHPSLPRVRGKDSLGRPNSGLSDPVDQYLWEVYQRKPIKLDSTGDFTWKDPAAAKRVGLSLKAYVIGGMDPDFREQLYHAGRAMDASGIRWSILSAFRDDYRQRLAAGFKAHGGNSQHGGSNATGGYGHGRAVDITSVEGEPGAAWHWIDAHGAKFGLRRPMPSADPAHIQPRNSFHDLARQLREARLKLENKLTGATAAATGKPSAVAQMNEAGDGLRVSR
ncbi:MAG TPA: hypothetical protein VKT99_23165 [Xanthobacteraceae bacterium]|jgi:hypothetical protein|nr:hypothetical protein [Xanthobacteraceae bacterium]